MLFTTKKKVQYAYLIVQDLCFTIGCAGIALADSEPFASLL